MNPTPVISDEMSNNEGTAVIVCNATDRRAGPAVFDCGQVLHGEKFTVKFSVRNRGLSEVKILRVSPDCGCMRLMAAPTVVKSHATEYIKLAFNASKRGLVENVVIVDYSQLGANGNTLAQRVSLRVTAEVK